jgi:hypothetical protein
LLFDSRLAGTASIPYLENAAAILAPKARMAALCAVTDNFYASTIFAFDRLEYHGKFPVLGI